MTLEKPSGNSFDSQQLHPMGNVFNSVAAGGSMDDEFFHITCHVNNTLRAKI